MGSIVTWYNGFLNDTELIHRIVIWVGTVFPIYVFVVTSKFTFKVIGKEIYEKKWLILKVVLVAAILTPLIAAGIVKVFTIPLVLGGIMLIAAIAVGDPFDLVDAHGKKGSLLMASAIMIVLVLLMPLTVPIWMGIFSQWFPLHLAASPEGIFTKVAVVALVPMLAGLLFRQFLPKVTDVLEKILHWYFKVSAILLVIIFIAGSIGKIINVFSVNGIIAMIIMTSITIISGYYAAKGAERKDRISISLACSLGNMAAVFFIAYHAYPELEKNSDFLITVFGWVVLRWIIIWIWYFIMKYRVEKKGEVLVKD